MKCYLGLILNFWIIVCLSGIALALHQWGAIEVRSDPAAVLVLTFIGAVWILLAFKIFPWLGLSFAHDVVDCRNTSAMIALSGAATAVALLYAAGNLGEGPSYLENFFSAGLGTATWLSLWFLLEISAKIPIPITEDRDLASGLRFCGLLVAAGALLGRATAGNWVSELATIRDFIHDGWPAVALILIAFPVEWLARPSPARPFPSWMVCGALPALFYLGLAGIWLWHLGRWEEMP